MDMKNSLKRFPFLRDFIVYFKIQAKEENFNKQKTKLQ